MVKFEEENMPAIRKNPEKPTNKQIGIRIYADNLEIKGSEYWKNLADLFSFLIKDMTKSECEVLLTNYPLASKVIEVI